MHELQSLNIFFIYFNTYIIILFNAVIMACITYIIKCVISALIWLLFFLTLLFPKVMERRFEVHKRADMFEIRDGCLQGFRDFLQ